MKKDALYQVFQNQWQQLGQPYPDPQAWNGGHHRRASLIFTIGTHFATKDTQALWSSLLDFALTVELLHMASLLHDDVLDNGQMRRGQRCLHHSLGHHQAILWGDWALALALQCMMKLNHGPLLTLMQQTMHAMVLGQLGEYALGPHSTEEDILYVVRGKTASLFSFACQGVALLLQLPTDLEHALHTYGLQWGMAYQCMDDYTEYTYPFAQWDHGHDFYQKRWTYPLYATYQALRAQFNPHQCVFQQILAWMTKDHPQTLGPNDVHKAWHPFFALGLKHTREKIQTLRHSCDTLALNFPESLAEDLRKMWEKTCIMD
jgi:geranylgeranyl pyrophosphate synthase